MEAYELYRDDMLCRCADEPACRECECCDEESCDCSCHWEHQAECE